MEVQRERDGEQADHPEGESGDAAEAEQRHHHHGARWEARGGGGSRDRRLLGAGVGARVPGAARRRVGFRVWSPSIGEDQEGPGRYDRRSPRSRHWAGASRGTSVPKPGGDGPQGSGGREHHRGARPPASTTRDHRAGSERGVPGGEGVGGDVDTRPPAPSRVHQDVLDHLGGEVRAEHQGGERDQQGKASDAAAPAPPPARAGHRPPAGSPSGPPARRTATAGPRGPSRRRGSAGPAAARSQCRPPCEPAPRSRPCRTRRPAGRAEVARDRRRARRFSSCTIRVISSHAPPGARAAAPRPDRHRSGRRRPRAPARG